MISCLILGIKVIVRINGNSAKRIDQLLKSRKVDTEIIVDILIVKHSQSIHTYIDTIDTCMCQLISLSARNRKRYKIITRCRNQKHLSGSCIYRSNDIGIASALCNKAAAAVDTTDKDGIYRTVIGTLFSLRLCLLRFNGRLHLLHGQLFDPGRNIGISIHLFNNA